MIGLICCSWYSTLTVEVEHVLALLLCYQLPFLLGIASIMFLPIKNLWRHPEAAAVTHVGIDAFRRLKCCQPTAPGLVAAAAWVGNMIQTATSE